VTLKWPDYFPPSDQDRLARINAIRAANGDKPVLAPLSAIKAAAPVFGVVTNAEEELERVLEGTKLFAEASAGSLGVRAADADVGGDEPDDAEADGAEA
jgi:hypothetical protein